MDTRAVHRASTRGPILQLASGAVISLPVFLGLWSGWAFGSYTELLLYVVAPLAVVVLGWRFSRWRWLALGAVLGIVLAMAWLWITAGSSVAPVPG